MNQMRETIRARTAAMGLEKSKVSADYVLQRQQQAMGNVAAADDSQEQSEQQQQQPQPSGDNDNNSPSNLPRLDLSQISTFKPASQQRASALWGSDEEELPSMFYDPEDELTEAQRAEIDPMIEKGMIEQALHELKSTKWPDPFSALREVGLMIVVVAVTGALIIGWDKVLRGVYTDGLHFIPSQQDLANYLQRFDGLDLPSGWTDNMNDADISAFTDNVSSNAKAINSNIGTSSSVVPPE